MSAKNWLTLGVMILALGVAGCASKPKGPSPEEIMNSIREPQPPQAVGANVLIVGSVKNSVIAWSQGLTLRNAIAAAQYVGVADPKEIAIIRAGQRPIYMAPAQLTTQDMLLEAGDRVELRQ